MRKHFLTALSILILSFAAAGCSSGSSCGSCNDQSFVPPPVQNFSITGTVTPEQADITITLLDGNGNQTAQTQTDENGSYRFENLPNGIYRIYIEKEDYVTLDLQIEISNANTVFDIVLTPIPAE